MSGAVTTPGMLRLVNAGTAPVSRFRIAAAQPDRMVWAENASAFRLDTTDARWVLAVKTTLALEGGQAAILRPHDRRHLVALAGKLGLRPFDAALVIAIAQDAARTGEALSGPAQDRLAMVRSTPAGSDKGLGTGALLLLSFFLGALFFSIMRTWLVG